MRQGEIMTRQQLVDQMVICEDGIITVTMPLDYRKGERSSFSFPGNEEAEIAVKQALYSLVTILYDDLFGRMATAMEMVPLDPQYRIRPRCMHFDLDDLNDPKSWEDNMCNFSKGPSAICPDIDTFLGNNLIFNPNGGSSSGSRPKPSD